MSNYKSTIIILLSVSCPGIQSAAQKSPEINIKESKIRAQVKVAGLPVVLENIILDYLKSKYTLKNTFKAHDGPVNALAGLSKCRLASAGKNIKIRDLKTNKDYIIEHHDPAGEHYFVEALDDDRLIYGSHKTIKIENLKTKEHEVIYRFHYDFVNELAVLKDGKIAAGDFYEIKIYDLKTNKYYVLCRETGRINALAALEGDRLAYAAFNRIIIWDLKTNENYMLARGHDTYVNALAALKGDRLASAGSEYEKTIKIYDLKNRSLLQTIDCDFEVLSLAELSNGDLAAGFKNGNIMIFSPETDINITKLPKMPWYSNLKFWKK